MAPKGRLVRRRPLSERVQEYLDPGDWFLWLSEQLESEWVEQLQDFSTAIGVAVNILFIIAKANVESRKNDGDVFGDDGDLFRSGWFSWFCRFLVYSLGLLSTTNAIHTLSKRRAYRLFEQSLDFKPSTPSARRVRVDSSPTANNTPMQLIHTVLSSFSSESTASRAHPQEGRDVWEVSVWDPTPLGLKLLCLFSPVHVLVYSMFLPTAPLDPTPSLTYFKTFLLVSVVSAQALFLRHNFEQQQKDKAIINREVLHEYDTKFVHPNLNPPVRDVGTQTPPARKSARHSADGDTRDARVGPLTPEVETYTPHTIINRGFHISPNPSYASQYDPDNLLEREEATRVSRSITTPHFGAQTPIAWRTPSVVPSAASSSFASSIADFSSPLRPVTAQRQQHRQSPVRHSTGTSTAGGEGGSLGVYSHAASPLRKAASQNFLKGKNDVDRVRREGSPLKRISTPLDFGVASDRGEGRRRRAADR